MITDWDPNIAFILGYLLGVIHYWFIKSNKNGR